VQLGHVDQRVLRVDASTAELGYADAVVLLTDHDSFDFGDIVAESAYVLDTRHRLTGPNVEFL
jgi:UDP-N-acetyl-D-glucosamine dehydrogenase